MGSTAGSAEDCREWGALPECKTAGGSWGQERNTCLPQSARSGELEPYHGSVERVRIRKDRVEHEGKRGLAFPEGFR